MRNNSSFSAWRLGLRLLDALSAGAVPISAAAVKEAAATTSLLQAAQYAETWWRRGGRIKCFREFVIGPYRCHWYPL